MREALMKGGGRGRLSESARQVVAARMPGASAHRERSGRWPRDFHAAHVDSVETRLCPAPTGRRRHAALRAEGPASGGPETGAGEPRAGREALRGPQGQVV